MFNSHSLAPLCLPITLARFSVAQFGSSCTCVITDYVSGNKCCSIRILLHFCNYQLRQRDLVLLNSDPLALLCLPITSARSSAAQFGSSCTSVITCYVSEIYIAEFGFSCTSVITSYVSEIQCCSMRILLHFCDYQLCQRDFVLLNSHLLNICDQQLPHRDLGCLVRILLHFCHYQLRQRDLLLLNSGPHALLFLPITSARFSVAQCGSSCTSVITNYVSDIQCCSIRILLQFRDYQLRRRHLVLLNSDPIALL